MASGTIYGWTDNQYIDSKIEWTATANNSSNTSDVTAKLYYKRNNTGFTTRGRGDFSISIGDQTRTGWDDITITENAWTLAMSTSVTVSHNDDGTCRIGISAKGAIEGTSLTATLCSGTVTLDTIPRASTITSVADKTLGTPCSVKWTPHSTTFSYQLKFALGNWSATTGKITPNTTSPCTFGIYVLPLTVAHQIPNAKTGTMTATLYTYSSNGEQIGSPSSKTFTVTVPDNEATKPFVDLELESVSTLGSDFSGVYIQGKSRVKGTVTREGQYSASIEGYGFTVANKGYESPFESDVLSTSGEISVVGWALDSRGYYNSDEKKINVIPYSNPSILPADNEKAIICARCDKDGNLTDSGTYLKIKARRGYSKVVSDGVQKNFCTIRYRYVEENAQFSGDTGWKTLLDGSNSTAEGVDIKLFDGTLDTATSYIVQLGVVDTLGESYTIQYIIPTDFVTIDVPEAHKGQRIGLFRYAKDTDEPGIDVGAPIYGGSIDSLLLGTRITATAASKVNLDDMKVAGCYYSPDKETTQYISGVPANVEFGFGLEIREMQSAINIRQTLYFGITTWYRHWNGTEWSAWVSSLRGVSDEVIAKDFVIDSGKSGEWRYRLWQSGDAELWAWITLSKFGDTRHIYADVGLPFPFTESPSVSMTLARAVEYGYRQKPMVLSDTYIPGESTIRLSMIRDEGGFVSGNYAPVSVIIKGRWK